MFKPMSLAVVFRNSYIRQNEQDGSTYRVYCYRVLKSSSPEAVSTFEADTQAAGYNVLHDEETGEPIYRTTRVVPPGCNTIIRSQAGRWVADTTQLDIMNDMAKRYPHLYGGVGQAIADQLFGKTRTAPVVQQSAPAQQTEANGLDPFES